MNSIPLRSAAAAALTRHRLAAIPRRNANEAATLAAALVEEGASVFNASIMATSYGLQCWMRDLWTPPDDAYEHRPARAPETAATNANVVHMNRYRGQRRVRGRAS